MFVILTSKPGQYRTEPSESARPAEAYDYRMDGQHRARFVIAELIGNDKLRVVDETACGTVNLVPAKFFPRFETIDAARQELKHLVSFGTVKTSLERVT